MQWASTPTPIHCFLLPRSLPWGGRQGIGIGGGKWAGWGLGLSPLAAPEEDNGWRPSPDSFWLGEGCDLRTVKTLSLQGEEP